MSKRCRYEDAVKDKNYRAVVDEAVIRLEAVGRFSKKEVLEKTGYSLFSFNWEFIQKMIEDPDVGMGIKLMKVSGKIFTRHRRDEEVSKPEQFLAGGNGKPAVGYALVGAENGHLVKYTVKYQGQILNGVTKSARTIVEKGLAAGIDGLVVPSITQQQHHETD